MEYLRKQGINSGNSSDFISSKITTNSHPKNLGNDNSAISNYKLANKAKNENLRCHKIHKNRTFPCGNIILLGIK